ncbi:GGDEF domain-containing protein [Roseateles sp. SL47]|uniref:GGDEF domain-containing protein n=1 Tax=Roseateles sp. SL47 TaxID=2995138 RepID=UPI002271B27D|nr:GGDEF domain-containing protein [Roseateles sp. SL47]WAC75469.1 GGDEF domain-containing protein [Roseateles sp. SL47]
MRYTESIAASAQALRTALPLMSRQRAALHPVSYAVWYEHVVNMNAALSRELLTLTKEGCSLDEAQTWSLYRRYIAELDEDRALHLSREVGDVLGGVTDCAERADQQVHHYAGALQRWLDALAHAAPGQHTQVLAAALQGTQDMQSAIGGLMARLALSREEVARLRQEVQRARSEALLDPLTGLGNRRAFEKALAGCLRSPDAGTPVAPCLVLGDIDDFGTLRQQLNNTQLEDVVHQVATAVRSVAQSHHVAVRLEEHAFALLLPDAGLHEAHQVAEQWRHGAAQVRPDDSHRISLSVGVTQLGREESARDFVMRAHQALSASRAQGRNRVTVLSADERFAA